MLLLNVIYLQVKPLFADTKPTDWVTICISVVALFFSLISYLQKTGENKLSRRNQLTELLEKLTDFNTEIAIFRSGGNKDKTLPDNYVALLNDQRKVFVRQAAFLARKIKRLVNPYEYLVIGWAFEGVDDPEQAERMYLLSTKTKDAFDRGIAVRSYARFLFNQWRVDEGRGAYADSVTLFGGGGPREIFSRSRTYERWAQQEIDWGGEANRDIATDLYQNAMDELYPIANEIRREKEMARISKLISEFNSNSQKG
jgi:hypothetical protein